MAGHLWDPLRWIWSKPKTKEYEEGWDRIFGKKEADRERTDTDPPGNAGVPEQLEPDLQEEASDKGADT